MKELWSQLLLVFAIAMVVSGISRLVAEQRQSVRASVVQDRGFGGSKVDSRGSANSMKGSVISVSSNAMKNDGKTGVDPAKDSGMGRVREGREITDSHATFQVVGERVTCNLKDLGLSVTTLENLTLERVHQYLSRGNSTTTWEVEGRITEYEGHNYFLLRRAIINSLESEE